MLTDCVSNAVPVTVKEMLTISVLLRHQTSSHTPTSHIQPINDDNGALKLKHRNEVRPYWIPGKSALAIAILQNSHRTSFISKFSEFKFDLSNCERPFVHMNSAHKN